MNLKLVYLSLDVCFSPRGNAIAWVSHDSSLNVYYPESQFLSVVKTASLPFVKLLWLGEGTIVAAGHDYIPAVFQGSDGTAWKLVEKINPGNKKNALASNSAFNKFKQMDSRKQDSASDLQLASVHQNSIIDLRIFDIDEETQTVSKFSSCGLDGKIVVWDLKALSKALENLTIS